MRFGNSPMLAISRQRWLLRKSNTEHLVVTISLSFDDIAYYPEMAFFISNPYSIVTSIDDFNYVITTNARVLIEHQNKLPVFISKATPTSWRFLFEEQA